MDTKRTGDSPARRAARLAMLAPDEDAQARAEQGLNEIIAFAGELGELDGDGLELYGKDVSAAPPDARIALRPDKPAAGMSLDDALMNAKSVNGRLIVIPRVFE